MAALTSLLQQVVAIALATAPGLATADPLSDRGLVRARSGSGASMMQWRPWILEASVRFGVPVAWIAAVMRAESGGSTHLDGRPIVSRAGAMGLMQLMPDTWRVMQRQHRLGFDPHEPRNNILAGAAYLRAMYDRFGYPGLFGAYNAGPERYAAYLARRQSLPAETWAYLAKTTSSTYEIERRTIGGSTTLFATIRDKSHSAPALFATSLTGKSIFFVPAPER